MRPRQLLGALPGVGVREAGGNPAGQKPQNRSQAWTFPPFSVTQSPEQDPCPTGFQLHGTLWGVGSFQHSRPLGGAAAIATLGPRVGPLHTVVGCAPTSLGGGLLEGRGHRVQPRPQSGTCHTGGPASTSRSNCRTERGSQLSEHTLRSSRVGLAHHPLSRSPRRPTGVASMGTGQDSPHKHQESTLCLSMTCTPCPSSACPLSPCAPAVKCSPLPRLPHAGSG